MCVAGVRTLHQVLVGQPADHSYGMAVSQLRSVAGLDFGLSPLAASLAAAEPSRSDSGVDLGASSNFAIPGARC